MSKTKSPAEIANRKAVRAAQARAYRAKNGATPRTESKASQLRELGVSEDAFYARQRRERLRAEADELRDTVSCSDDGDTWPVIEPAPAPETVTRDTVARERDGDTSPDDGVPWPVSPELVQAEPDSGPTFIPYDQGPPPDDGRLWLFCDLFERGWKLAPSIRAPASAEPPIDAMPGRADRLIAAVAGLPGGRELDHQKVLRRLVDAAEARERTR